jgi:hypothetical protein
VANEKLGSRVVEIRTVHLGGNELMVVKLDDGSFYVPMRWLCEDIGLDWAAQYRRIRRDELLNPALRGVVITATPSWAEGCSDYSREMLCLPLELIPGWLAGVHPSWVSEESRDRLIRYQRETFRHLGRAFKSRILPELQDPEPELTPARRTLAQIEALYIQARHRALLETWAQRRDTTPPDGGTVPLIGAPTDTDPAK